uniref:Uncharacterized protein n=1 Tax=Eutreptiella gymnastica TaxID=73025 RepID=A0A7S4FYZ4_9EUGL
MGHWAMTVCPQHVLGDLEPWPSQRPRVPAGYYRDTAVQIHGNGSGECSVYLPSLARVSTNECERGLPRAVLGDTTREKCPFLFCFFFELSGTIDQCFFSPAQQVQQVR